MSDYILSDGASLNNLINVQIQVLCKARFLNSDLIDSEQSGIFGIKLQVPSRRISHPVYCKI